MRQGLLGVIALTLLWSAPGLAQGGAQVEVRRSVDRTAVWVGDRLRYTIEFTMAGDLDVLAEDVARQRLPIKGGDVIGHDTSERVTASGRVRIVQFTITTVAVNAPEIVIEQFPVRYFSRRTVGETQVAPAGQVTVPRLVIPIRSTLPDTGRLPELREPQTLASPAPYLRFARRVGLVLMALALVPVVVMLVDVGAYVRRVRAGSPRRKAWRAHGHLLEELAARHPETPHERLEAYERLDHLVRDHLEVAAAIPARALTPAEIGIALRDRRAGGGLPDTIQSLLTDCERSRYAPDPPSSDAWRDAVNAAAEIVRLRKI